jgi:hypothetical protein
MPVRGAEGWEEIVFTHLVRVVGSSVLLAMLQHGRFERGSRILRNLFLNSGIILSIVSFGLESRSLSVSHGAEGS